MGSKVDAKAESKVDAKAESKVDTKAENKVESLNPRNVLRHSSSDEYGWSCRPRKRNSLHFPLYDRMYKKREERLVCEQDNDFNITWRCETVEEDREKKLQMLKNFGKRIEKIDNGFGAQRVTPVQHGILCKDPKKTKVEELPKKKHY